MTTTNLAFSAALAALLLSSAQARADMLIPEIAACCGDYLRTGPVACYEAGTPCAVSGDSGTCQPSTCTKVVTFGDAACVDSGGGCLAQVPCTTCSVPWQPPDAGATDDASSPVDAGADAAEVLDAGTAGGEVGSEPPPAHEASPVSGGGCGCSTTGEGGLRALLPWLVAGAVPLLVRRRGRRGAP